MPNLDANTQAALDAEIEAGAVLVTLNEMKAELARHGYSLDRSMDCRCMARIMTGPLAGTSFKACSMRIRETDTRRSASHFEGRRDAAYDAMRKFARNAYVILPGGYLASAA